jgi:Domain of unknown function (DUF4136)
MSYTHSCFGRGVTHAAFGVLVMATACKGRTVSVASGSLDTMAVRQFKTFSIMAPTPPADSVAVGATNGRDRVAGAVMDMDPMLSTSLVGRAIRQDLSSAFTDRGYQAVEGTPDFYVAYYAGTGRVVDTRASEKSYHTTGQKITTQTYEYPAGTIVVDVVDARSNSLVWRGTGIAEIPKDPNDYARAIHETVEKVVGTFPSAQR